MSLVEYAKRELGIINSDQQDEMQNDMDRHILHMIEEFSKEGHSGFSANYAINILSRLLRFKPLTPLTGEDDEFILISSGLYQNNRCGAVFKKEGKGAYYIEGKVFSDDGGETWYTNKESHVPVTFPFWVPDKPEFIILESE